MTSTSKIMSRSHMSRSIDISYRMGSVDAQASSLAELIEIYPDTISDPQSDTNPDTNPYTQKDFSAGMQEGFFSGDVVEGRAEPDRKPQRAEKSSSRAKQNETERSEVEYLLSIAARHDLIAPQLETAFEIVRKFLRKRRRVIYGGTSIDFALRLKGTQLYSDLRNEAYPDYDFYSPDHLTDAYDLAEELRAADLPNVGAIQALHFQTMRVRIDFVPVADISFMPASVYEILDRWTLEYEGMRLTHPHFQRLDLHSALAYPYDRAPQEAVFERFKKDVARLNLLMELYPIEEKQFKKGELKLGDPRDLRRKVGGKSADKESADKFANKKSTDKFKPTDSSLLMVYGGSALLALHDLYLVECARYREKPLAPPPELTGAATGSPQIASLYHEFPPEKFPQLYKNVKEKCRPLMDIQPARWVGPDVVLYDISARLPACVQMRELAPLLVPSAQLVLLWLLQEALWGRGGIQYYQFLIRVIQHVEDMYARHDAPKSLITTSPFLACLEVHGSGSMNPSQLRMLAMKMGEHAGPSLNWYPARGRPRPRPDMEIKEFVQDGHCRKK